MATQQRDEQRNDEEMLAERIREQMRAALGQNARQVVVAIARDGAILLDGTVETGAMRGEVARIAAGLADGRRVENNVEVEQYVAGGGSDARAEIGTESEAEEAVADGDDAAERGSFDGRVNADDADVALGGDAYDGALTVPLETDESDVVDESVYDDLDPVEEDPAYFALADPVVGSDTQGNLEVLNGFAPDALSDRTIDGSVEDGRQGDEALADAVTQQLRRDATTTDLHVNVQVRQGVVRLRGMVPSLQDAENAEAVAGDVPYVREVIEELEYERPDQNAQS